jgi:hypothetical protein
MLSRLEGRRGVAREQVLHRLAKRFDRLEEALRSALAQGELPESQEEPLRASELVKSIILLWTVRMESELGAIQTIADDAHVHAARIAGKRLRYVLEPFKDELSDVSLVINRLKDLQGLLGDFHDSHRLAGALLQESRAAAVVHADWSFQDCLPWASIDSEMTTGRRRDPRSGLLALARSLRVQGEKLYATLRTEWLEGGAARRLYGDLRAITELREGGGAEERGDGGTGNGERGAGAEDALPEPGHPEESSDEGSLKLGADPQGFLGRLAPSE